MLASVCQINSVQCGVITNSDMYRSKRVQTAYTDFQKTICYIHVQSGEICSKLVRSLTWSVDQDWMRLNVMSPCSRSETRPAVTPWRQFFKSRIIVSGTVSPHLGLDICISGM